ncbi:MAG TPA: hypothetical protein VFX25_18180 [Streptosporangiaceae bacterium]|nr:hypothetical protein [Streptosporangiaceae bacterium]
MTWRRCASPKGYGPGPAPTVTWADVSDCSIIGFAERNGTVRDSRRDFTSGKDAVQCTVIELTSDGGKTWTTSTFARSMPYPMVDALTCPAATTCCAAGSDLIAPHIGSICSAGASARPATR